MGKEYLQSPTFDLPPPPDGPLKLGQILDNPVEPRYSLNGDDVVAISPSDIHTMPAEGVSATRSQLNESNFKLWAKLTDRVPVGASADVGRKRDGTDVFTIEKLETTYFLPSKKYLEASIKAPDVKQYLEGSRWGGSVYIITGLKIARGTSVKSTQSREKKQAGDVSASLTTANVPLGGGVAGARQVITEEETNIERLGDFVLAYQLRKVLYMKGRPVKHEAYNVGAMYSADDAKLQEEEVLVEGLEEKDFVPSGETDGGDWEFAATQTDTLHDTDRVWLRLV